MLVQARSEFAQRKGTVGSVGGDERSEDDEDESAEEYLLPGANITIGSDGYRESSLVGLGPAAVGLPSQQELEALLVEQKKKLLLERILI